MRQYFHQYLCLDNLISGYFRNTKCRREFFGIWKCEHIKSTLAVELFAFYTVDMKKDKIDCFLRKIIKRASAWNNVSKHSVVLLNGGLFLRGARLAEKQLCLGIFVGVVFKCCHITASHRRCRWEAVGWFPRNENRIPSGGVLKIEFYPQLRRQSYFQEAGQT